MHKKEVVTDGPDSLSRLVGHATNCSRPGPYVQEKLLRLQKYKTLPNLQCLLFMDNTLPTQHIAHTFL